MIDEGPRHHFDYCPQRARPARRLSVRHVDYWAAGVSAATAGPGVRSFVTYFARSVRTESDAPPPSPRQCWTRSLLSSTCAGFVRGLYVPSVSTNSLSRLARASVTTTRKNGFFFEPTRVIRIDSIYCSCENSNYQRLPVAQLPNVPDANHEELAGDAAGLGVPIVS